MYFPYLRGKQYELIALRDMTELFGDSQLVSPIIEPVRSDYKALNSALYQLSENGFKSYLILNPKVGQLRGQEIKIDEVVQYSEAKDINSRWVIPAVILSNDTLKSDLDVLDRAVKSSNDFEAMVIHSEPVNVGELNQRLGAYSNLVHAFIDPPAIYLSHFADNKKVYISDGFRPAARNRDYGDSDPFSDLYMTYDSVHRCYGFGDFQTIGNSFSDSGGLAYAIALHVTYVDANRWGLMYCAHFVSDSNDAPVDHAGKFIEATGKLSNAVSTGSLPILETSAVKEFLELNSKRHYPGLGYIKKLSILHHLELITKSLRKSL